MIGRVLLLKDVFRKHENDVSGLRRYDLQSWWGKDWNGSGVRVAVVDDGLDYRHDDLKDVYVCIIYFRNGKCYSLRIVALKDDTFSVDLSSLTPTKNVLPQSSEDTHGTDCAGIIAAKGHNQKCGVGIARNVTLSAIRLQLNATNDLQEAAAFSYGMQNNDIYSISWGPDDDGDALSAPGELTNRSLATSTIKGRDGKGNVYVMASGNGGPDDGCNFDGYSNSIYGIAVTAVSGKGTSPDYAEPCAAALTSAYSSLSADLAFMAIVTFPLTALE